MFTTFHAGYCKILAEAFHYRQTRRGGLPYTSHTNAVCSIASDIFSAHSSKLAIPNGLDLIKCVAHLHDAMEDSGIASSVLSAMLDIKIKDIGFVDRVIKNLLLLTHDDSTPYDLYISDILNSAYEDPIALIVKLADMRHNMECCMSELKTGPNPKSAKQLEKYSRNYNLLAEKFHALTK